MELILEPWSKVYDTELPQMGEGVILQINENNIVVHFPNVEEVINYSIKDGIKFLELL